MGCFLKTDYAVGLGSLYLTIFIGDAQLGTSVVSLNGNKIAEGVINNLLIGGSTQLKGKSLNVKTIVSDVSDKTNHTSVTYLMSGGLRDTEYKLEATVAVEGDSIVYKAEFNFI